MVLKKIRDGIHESDKTHEEIGDKSGVASETIGRIAGGKRGKNLSLNMALRIWEGLGNQPETLLIALEPDALTARRVQAILSGPRADLFKLFLEVLHAGGEAEPFEMSELQGFLKGLLAVFRARKSPEPAAPGADCSPSSAA